MTISCTNRGTGADNASGSTTYAFSPSGNYAAGSLAVVCVSADNSGTGGAANNIVSVTDTIGNTWTLVQLPIFDNGAASAGIQGLIAVSHMSAGTLTTGTTITVTFLNSTVAKSYTLHEVVPTSGLIATYKTGGVAAGQSGTTAPTMTTGTISVGNLLIATFAMESGTTQTFTDDSDANNGSWSASQYSEIGSTTSGNCIGTQYKIQTTTGSTQTYNPTLGAAADTVGAWAEFTEVNPVVLPKTHTELPVNARRSPQAGYLGIAYGLNQTNLYVSVTNIALTTQAVTASAGTLGVNSTIALTGQAVTTSAGTVAADASFNYTTRGPLYVNTKRTKSTLPTDVSRNLLTTTLAGGSDVSLALTGTAVTTSAGTLAPFISIQLSGTAVSCSAGTLVPSMSIALTGQPVTVSAGTLGASLTIIPAGQAVTVSAGTLAPTMTLALSGQALTASTGTLVPSASISLSGQAISASPGTLGASASVALTGQAVTSSAGTLTPSSGVFVDISLTGQALAATAGTLAPSTSVALSGQEASATPGTLGVSESIALTGQAVTASTGTLTAAAQYSLALSGQAVTTSPGTLGVSETIALSGQSVTASTGTLTATALYSVALSGQAVTASPGTLAKTFSVALSGQDVTTYIGTLTPVTAGDVTLALTGLGVICYAGTLTAEGQAVSTKPPGGSGYPVYWQGKRRAKRLIDQPNLHLKKILDDVVQELYGEIVEDAPPDVQAKAAKLVKPFVDKKSKKVAVPPETAVDWNKLQQDAARVQQIIALWRKQEIEKEIEDEDEFMLMID